MNAAALWPALPYPAWRETAATLQLWTQIVGKVRLTLTPWANHGWQVPLYVTARGLGTSPIPVGGEILELEFDFIGHRLVARTSRGEERTLALEPQTVADFHRALMDVLGGLGVGVRVGGDLNPKRPVRVGDGSAADPAVEADKVESAPAGDASALRAPADRADRGKFLIVACNDEHLALRGPVGDDRGGHAREEDRVVEWDEGKSFHRVLQTENRMNANDYRTSSFVVRLICHERH